MNTPKTGIRTILAAAAAGALVLGSAAGVSAAPKVPSPAQGPKAGSMQLRMVDVHNGFINVNPAAKHRDLKLKANVWDSVKASNPTHVDIVLAQYDKKGVKSTENIKFAEQTVALTLKGKAKKSQNYRAVLKGADVAAAVTGLAVGDSILICLADADLMGGTNVKDNKKQVTKKIGRDCVKVVNLDPEATESASDDK
jgi:hypothetical protein